MQGEIRPAVLTISDDDLITQLRTAGYFDAVLVLIGPEPRCSQRGQTTADNGRCNRLGMVARRAEVLDAQPPETLVGP
ncbi:hypothetical protein A5630_21235 [Mycolicibacterium mucogenicum]|uniref:Uncharacterized protein n=1 Tax=Mycolicibacterium mucogenicum TaxID=56689 RepID=A0A1A3H3N0_MYCMU|nr:hypothetical protein A5630_21235 [Mycolicibacterium mucogenicum]